MKALATAILGTLAVSCLTLALPKADAFHIGSTGSGPCGSGGLLSVGSDDMTCAIHSHTCVMGYDVGFWIWTGNNHPALWVGYGVSNC